MKRLTCPVRLALTTLALFGLAGTGRAQQPPQDLVPFKATFTATFQSLTIPLNPPIVSQHVSGSGQADFLGQFTVAARRTSQLGPDGQEIWGGGNPGVFTAANGDAIFWATNGVTGGAGAFLITGGKGRFAEAVGSGTGTATPDPAKGTVTFSWVGMITRPKP
jgi:hypothetical protein